MNLTSVFAIASILLSQFAFAIDDRRELQSLGSQDDVTILVSAPLVIPANTFIYNGSGNSSTGACTLDIFSSHVVRVIPEGTRLSVLSGDSTIGSVGISGFGISSMRCYNSNAAVARVGEFRAALLESFGGRLSLE